jgi:hypothetical protein
LSASTQPSPSPGVFTATAAEPIGMLVMPSTPMKSVATDAVADTVTVRPRWTSP